MLHYEELEGLYVFAGGLSLQYTDGGCIFYVKIWGSQCHIKLLVDCYLHIKYN